MEPRQDFKKNAIFSHKTVSRMFQKRILQRTCPMGIQDLKRSTLILAPHADDEVLGCGGMIAAKTAIGCKVKIVILTDGRRSHGNHVDPSSLIKMRKWEAIQAAQTMGISRENLYFLNYPDARLKTCISEAKYAVANMIDEFKPEMIVIPHINDYPADHQATRKILFMALNFLNYPVSIFEYLIWAWMVWPMTSVFDMDRHIMKAFKRLIKNGFGFQLLTKINMHFDIRPFMHIKKKAIDQYRSQTVRILDEAGYPVLNEIANGDFLNACFQPYEFFRSYPFKPEKEG